MTSQSFEYVVRQGTGRLVSGMMVCAALLVGCGAAPNQTASKATQDLTRAPQAESVVLETNDSGNGVTASVAQPQLIRRARLSLEVEDAIASVKSIRAVVQQQQGDVLNLQEETLPGDGSPRRASLELRIPQANLDTTLDELSNLGTVENRAITAEDVSSQIVDASARLRNLRKQEEMILGIMERSGEISEVLEVSNQLATVRQSIEQLDAQLQHLKTQVAYSTISLTLAEPLAAAATRTSFGNEIKAAWTGASSSVGAFTRSLLVMGLWLVAYSPYLLVITAVIYGMRRSRRRSRSLTSPPPSSSSGNA